MQKLFWTLVTVDGALFLYLLISTLRQRSPADGGREMALFFGVLVPGAIVGLGVLVYALASSTSWRVIGLIIVAAPLVLLAVVRLRSAYIDYTIRHGAVGGDISSGGKP
ncbi:MAG: hypothetical protein ACE145_03265 [Terriglobia bacterium]